jgi:hypothetical protein
LISPEATQGKGSALVTSLPGVVAEKQTRVREILRESQEETPQVTGFRRFLSTTTNIDSQSHRLSSSTWFRPVESITSLPFERQRIGVIRDYSLIFNLELARLASNHPNENTQDSLGWGECKTK